ncbi:Na+/H+ antiporter NhaC [Endozoicomonas sp. SCSIO W0465]|uniref:Na+/H+ antiporter NhaC n=1 Tax=Endozoicomonas sp. SCSIO W0465 TaxID=2918516 RepID=UPI002075335A|nr:Na+/H+ antiporter NhaC [Endozoicomonas sp. SCSIO W0465]USE38542.1 Na+/H+ antiporter NhaC [Endozoicomonas sp. SCSIO W0465]
MTVSTQPETSWKEPGFLHAFITLAAIIAVISTGLFILETSLHSLILVSLMIASVSAFSLGYDFRAVRDAMNSGITGALTAIYIFILIGVLIAAFIQSGTLATLIYYGIEFVSPAIFLPAGLILCSLMSLATGTSWGTVGTIGVVLMGIGTTMGIPAPLVAGMVISGACFGDKMSPVSDTTNLASMTSKVDLYAHIRGMLFTTGPAYILALVVFSLMGLDYAENQLPTEQLSAMQVALQDTFTINALTLLPLIIMLALSTARVAAEPSMMMASSVAVVIAIFIQDQSLTTVLGSLYGGGSVRTGLESMDSLLGRGGITSMMWTLSLSLMALALGGILERCRFLRVLIHTVVTRIKRTSTLVTTTIIACFTGNMTMGEAYMSIILGGQLFSDAYDQKGVDSRVLSRSLEEGATLTTALIPWTTGGAFFASTLGVAVIDYAPWALLNWLSPVFAMVFAVMGFGLFGKDQNLQQTSPAV